MRDIFTWPILSVATIVVFIVYLLGSDHFWITFTLLGIPITEQIAIVGFHGLNIRLANQQKIVSELLFKTLCGEKVPLLNHLPYDLDLGMTV